MIRKKAARLVSSPVAFLNLLNKLISRKLALDHQDELFDYILGTVHI